MNYLDTNIFIYAIENHPKYGGRCEKILLDVERGILKTGTSMFTLVELISTLTKLNKILKKEGKKLLDIRENVDAILSYPLTWFDLGFPILRKASEYSYSILPVDYVHVATMELNSITKIISADADFDEVEFIKRVDPLDYK